MWQRKSSLQRVEKDITAWLPSASCYLPEKSFKAAARKRDASLPSLHSPHLTGRQEEMKVPGWWVHLLFHFTCNFRLRKSRDNFFWVSLEAQGPDLTPEWDYRITKQDLLKSRTTHCPEISGGVTQKLAWSVGIYIQWPVCLGPGSGCFWNRFLGPTAKARSVWLYKSLSPCLFLTRLPVLHLLLPSEIARKRL